MPGTSEKKEAVLIIKSERILLNILKPSKDSKLLNGIKTGINELHINTVISGVRITEAGIPDGKTSLKIYADNTDVKIWALIEQESGADKYGGK